VIVVARGWFLRDMSFTLVLSQAWPMALIGLSPADVAVRRVLIR
jgi:hypothetical protein